MRARAADDVVSSPGLKPWEPRALRQEKIDVSVQAMRQEGRGKFLLCLPFLFFGPSDNEMIPTLVGEGSLFYWVCQLKCSSHLQTSSQTHAEIVSNLSTPWPVKLTVEATVNKMKEQVTLERKDLQGIHLVKGLCPEYIKNSQKEDSPVKNRAKYMNTIKLIYT